MIDESGNRLLTSFDKRLEKISTDYQELHSRVEKLETIAEKVTEIQAELTEIKSQLKRSENSLVTTDFRISNVSYRENENVFHIIAKICTTVNIPIPSINAIFRLKNHNNKFTGNSPDAVMLQILSGF